MHGGHGWKQRRGFAKEGFAPGPDGGAFRWEGPWGGPGGWGFGPPGRARRAKGGRGWGARRGDVRAAVLALLEERPMHGYEMIQELEGRTGGVWRPSPGSIYPTLQLLEDQGMVSAEETEGRRVFTITDEGRSELASRPGGSTPWDEVSAGVDRGLWQLRDAMMGLGAAVRQVARAGNDQERAEVVEILNEARRRVYTLLAGQQG